MKTGLPVTPFARGGNRCPVGPTQFDPAATKLVRLAVDVAPIDTEITCSNPYVEGNVIDNAAGTLVTLVNWTLSPAAKVGVSVKMPAAPKSVPGARHAARDARNGKPGKHDWPYSYALHSREACRNFACNSWGLSHTVTPFSGRSETE